MRHAKRHYLCDTVEQQFTHLGYLAVKVVAGSNPVSPTRVRLRPSRWCTSRDLTLVTGVS